LAQLLQPQQKQDNTFTATQNEKAKNLIDAIWKIKKMAIWLPIGATIYFQYAPNSFFKRALELWTILQEEKLAWLITMLEYFGHLSYYGTFSFENCLLDNELKNLIHYRHGIPPVFDKRMFTFEPPNVFGMGNPYDILLANKISNSVIYIQELIKRSQKE